MVVQRSPLAKTERNDEIVRRVMDGKGTVNLRELGDEYGITRARVQRIVGLAGISVRKMKRLQRKPPRSQCRICRALYVKGSYAQHCEAAGHRRLKPYAEKIERNARVVWLYDKGHYNTSEIAESERVPQPIITRILHRAGIYPEGRRKRKGGLAQIEVAGRVDSAAVEMAPVMAATASL